MGPINEKALLQQEARQFFSKPFNLEHAKAGAPYACRCGLPATILKWDGRGDQPLIGVWSEQDNPATWHTGGEFHLRGVPGERDLVMTPLGYIDGKPVFVGDEIELKCFPLPNEWKRVKAEPSWAGTWTDDCARWPKPEKQYPVTGMTGKQLEAIFMPHPIGDDRADLVAVANAALRHAIDSGQLPTKESYDELSADLGKAERLLESLGYRIASHGKWTAPDCAARDMAVARAVLEAAAWRLEQGELNESVRQIRMLDLAAIIAKVQP